MKNIRILLSVFIAIAIMTNLSAQEEEKKVTKKMFNVHTDQVKPSMFFEYQKISKELVALMKTHNITDVSWMTSQTDEMEFMYVGAIDKMGDLDKQYFATLVEKAGEEKVMDLFDRMDKCYAKHFNTTVKLDMELSYMPDGMDINMTDQLYREWNYFYYEPQNHDAIVGMCEKFRDSYIAAKAPVPYRIYHSGFGSSESFVLVVKSAVDAVDLKTREKARKELMEEQFKTLVPEFLSHCSRVETKTGNMRPDLSYGEKPLSSR